MDQLVIRRVWQLERKAWSVAARAVVLPVTCLAARRNRHLVWRLWDVCFGAERPGVYPEVALSRLLDRTTPARVMELPAEPYHVSETELLALALLSSQVRARTIFEFGTADGRTTRNLAANVAPGGRVYTLNLQLHLDATHSQTVPVGFRFLGSPEAERITQLWGRSTEFEFAPYLGGCQLVFVDADHSEAAVWADSQVAMRLVDREAGVVVWHDALRFGIPMVLPRLIKEQEMPIHLVARTNLAILCFARGRPVLPSDWVRALPR